MTREEAYRIVQEKAMKVWQDETLNFKNLLLQDERVASLLLPSELDALFDVNKYLQHVDYIFERVFGKASS
jgi:Adenylosuccinate lyase (EC 4.3.2.2)